jgi:hypothetical protein
LCGYETWFLILNEKHKFGVFGVSENRELRRIFKPKRKKVGGGGKLETIKELHDLYSSLNINRVIVSRRMRRYNM